MPDLGVKNDPILFVISYKENYDGTDVYTMTTTHPVGFIENRMCLEADDIFNTMKILTTYFNDKGYDVQFEVK